MERLYKEAGSDLTYEEDYTRVLEIARRKAMTFDGQWVDRDDISQDAVVRVLDQSQKNGYVNISKSAKEGGRAGVVVQAVSHSIIRVNHQGEHHSSVSGRKVLSEQRKEMETKLGRGLSPREVEDLAEDVRMNLFKPGRRPAPGYHVHRVESLSTDERDEEGRITNYGTLTHEDSYPSHSSEGDTAALGRLHDRLEAGKLKDKDEREENGGLTQAQARIHLWSAYREQNPDMPNIVEVPKSQRDSAIKQVDQAGGAYEVASRWLDNEITDPQVEESFFTAWGGSWDTSHEQKIAVAEKVAQNSAYSEHLWAAALGVPAKKR